jgi:hypothetical protein
MINLSTICYMTVMQGVTLTQARESVTAQVVNTLHAYRKYCAANSSAVQLILPESLKLLPLYALAFLKGQGLKVGHWVDGWGTCWQQGREMDEVLVVIPLWWEGPLVGVHGWKGCNCCKSSAADATCTPALSLAQV